MSKGKAAFAAAREELALSRGDVAYMLGADVEEVDRWEEPGYPDPKPAAWALIEGMRRAQEERVEETVAAILNAGGGGPVQITYYRSQEQYNGLGRELAPVAWVNATSRMVAWRLLAEGVEADFCYPDNPENVYRQARVEI